MSRLIGMTQTPKSAGALGGAKKESSTSSTRLLPQETLAQMLFKNRVKEIRDAGKEREKEAAEIRKDRAEFVFVGHNDKEEWTEVDRLGMMENEEQFDDSDCVKV